MYLGRAPHMQQELPTTASTESQSRSSFRPCQVCMSFIKPTSMHLELGRVLFTGTGGKLPWAHAVSAHVKSGSESA